MQPSLALSLYCSFCWWALRTCHPLHAERHMDTGRRVHAGGLSHPIRCWHRDKTAVVSDSRSPESRTAGTGGPVLRPCCDPGMVGKVGGGRMGSLPNGASREVAPESWVRGVLMKLGRAGREEGFCMGYSRSFHLAP